MRMIFITDFSEQFAYRLLRGILQYADETEPWVVCKMPPAYKRQIGMRGVLNWAKHWKADVIIGQFEPDDDVSMFRREGIVALAQGIKEVGDLYYDDITDMLWVSDSEAFKLFVFDGAVTKLLATYDVSFIGNPEAVLVDHARSCVRVGDDRGSSSRIYKISFYLLFFLYI